MGFSIWSHNSGVCGGAGAAGEASGATRSGETASEAARIGIAREAKVAEMVRGRVAREIIVTRFGKVEVDVLGPNGELITVGGPAKAADPPRFGTHLQRLKLAAEERGVPAQAYLEEGTPQSVIDLAIRWLGKDNVFILPK